MAKKPDDEKYRTLSMCDFCSYEIERCGAQPVFARDLNFSKPLRDSSAVIACDKYKSPVEILQKRFH